MMGISICLRSNFDFFYHFIFISYYCSKFNISSKSQPGNLLLSIGSQEYGHSLTFFNISYSNFTRDIQSDLTGQTAKPFHPIILDRRGRPLENLGINLSLGDRPLDGAENPAMP
jgi:hypothetical protein